MTLQPGQYLRDVTISALDPRRGAALFSVKGHQCFLLNRDIPHLTLRPGVTIKQLVCVRYEFCNNRYECAPPGCLDRIAGELYFRSDTLQPFFRLDRRDAWLDRWKRIILNQEKISISRMDMDNAAIPGNTWLYLNHQDWALPVLMDNLFTCMAGKYAFFPAPMQYVRGCSKQYGIPGHPIYCEDNIQQLSFDRQLSAKLRYYPVPGSPGRETDVVVRLHPPLDPKKWHFILRKHCFPDCKTSTERPLWQRLFSENGLTDIPDYSTYQNFFKNCKSNLKKKNCLACTPDKYSDLHDKLGVFLHELVRQSVTVFHDRMTNDTNGVKIALEKIFPDVYGAQILLQQHRPEIKSAKRRLVYLFRGILFIDETKNNGVLSINPVTQYAASKLKPLVFEKNIFFGKLHHVQKSD